MKSIPRSALLVVLSAVLSAATARAGQDTEQRRPAKAEGAVEITNRAGSVKVIGWDRLEVAVSGALGDGASGIELASSSDKTTIEVKARGNPMETRSSVEVRVPRRSRVKVKGFELRIDADGLAGTFAASAVEGSVAIVRGPPEVTIKTVSGSIDVAGPASRVQVESVNGSVNVRDAGGEVRAKSVNGSVVVVGTRFDRVHLRTVSGRLQFQGELTPQAQLDARTVNGSIELRLPASTAAEFALGTTNGRLESEFSPEPRSGVRLDRKLTFVTGAGTARVEASSVNGSVIVKKR
jgi:DUF4097 and DUF4098 domain-containing protein YvlB